MIFDLKNGKIFGHPVHLMLVHFPAALLPLSFLSDAAGILFNDPALYLTGFYLAAGGVILGMLAAISGLFDLLNMQQGSKEQSIAIIHGSLGLIWLIVFGVIAIIQVIEYPHISAPGLTILAGKGVSVAGLLYSNYLGGELVLKYKIGMRRSQEKIEELQ